MRTSPTGWVDPMTPADWAQRAAWSDRLRARAAKRDKELAAKAAKEQKE